MDEVWTTDDNGNFVLVTDELFVTDELADIDCEDLLFPEELLEVVAKDPSWFLDHLEKDRG